MCIFSQGNCFLNHYYNWGLLTEENYRHCVKSVRIWSFSGPYFPAFGLNTERYGVVSYPDRYYVFFLNDAPDNGYSINVIQCVTISQITDSWRRLESRHFQSTLILESLCSNFFFCNSKFILNHILMLLTHFIQIITCMKFVKCIKIWFKINLELYLHEMK